MRALAALSRFVGNTFAYWVLLFAVLAFFVPGCSANCFICHRKLPLA